MKLIIYLIYLYLTIYTVYFIALANKGLNKIKKARDEYKKHYNNFCVVVYSHNNKDTVENLIKQLKNQTYPQTNYTIQLLLDNCTDETELTFQGDLGVNILNFKNNDTIGRDQAFSILAEKYSAIKDLDAYVFIDANYYVNNDFLERINDSLQNNDVVTGAISLICNSELSILENIKYVYNLYKNNFISRTRDMLGLSNLVNSDILAMKKYVIDEIGSLNFKDSSEELKYTLMLSSMNIKTGFNPDAKVYIDIEKHTPKTPSLSKRIGLFFENILKIKTDNFNFNELVFSLIYPNCLTVGLLYYVVFNYAFNVKCILNYYVVGVQIALFIIAFCVSLLNSKIHSKNHLYLFLYPIYALFKVTYNFPPLRFIRKLLFKSGEISHIEKLTVQVFVHNGKRYFPCKLEIISESKFTKIVFINNKKKYHTKNHLRVIDAIKEISQKLDSYGYTLRICQCCKYFEPHIDGTVNQIKGFCKFPFADRKPGDILPTLLWNACDSFEKVNVVNLFESISAKKEDKTT